MIDEYLHSKKIEDVMECITETVESERIVKCICLGHFIIWGFSKTRSNFQEVSHLLVALHKSAFVSSGEVEEGYSFCFTL